MDTELTIKIPSKARVAQLVLHNYLIIIIMLMAGSFCVFVYDARINGFLLIVT
jgi:hypothetical protein